MKRVNPPNAILSPRKAARPSTAGTAAASAMKPDFIFGIFFKKPEPQDNNARLATTTKSLPFVPNSALNNPHYRHSQATPPSAREESARKALPEQEAGEFAKNAFHSGFSSSVMEKSRLSEISADYAPALALLNTVKKRLARTAVESPASMEQTQIIVRSNLHAAACSLPFESELRNKLFQLTSDTCRHQLLGHPQSASKPDKVMDLEQFAELQVLGLKLERSVLDTLIEEIRCESRKGTCRHSLTTATCALISAALNAENEKAKTKEMNAHRRIM